MESIYKINHELDVPIYKQLVDSIRVNIKQGILAAGQQLPTVQEMTTSLGIARGTIKRAYDELEHAGFIEKVQGRGTFVRYQPINSGSRKEQAMAEIDALLNSLEDMGLSKAEINIFLNLKLRERSEEESLLKVAVIECNPENLSQMSEQLRHIPGLDLYSYLTDSVEQYPYQISDDFSIIVTTSSHSAFLEKVLPDQKKIARVALRPSPRFLSHVIKLRAREKVGIISYSDRFSQLLVDTVQTYAEDVITFKPFSPSGETSLLEYTKGKDALIVPKNFSKLFSSLDSEILNKFDGDLIEAYYEMDEGSLLYLERKIKKLHEEKTI